MYGNSNVHVCGKVGIRTVFCCKSVGSCTLFWLKIPIQLIIGIKSYPDWRKTLLFWWKLMIFVVNTSSKISGFGQKWTVFHQSHKIQSHQNSELNQPTTANGSTVLLYQPQFKSTILLYQPQFNHSKSTILLYQPLFKSTILSIPFWVYHSKSTFWVYHSESTILSLPFWVYHSESTILSLPCWVYHAESTILSLPFWVYHSESTILSLILSLPFYSINSTLPFVVQVYHSGV